MTRKRKDTTSDLPLLHIAPLSVVTVSLLNDMHDHHLLHIKNRQCTFMYGNKQQCEKMLILRESTVYHIDKYELVCAIHGGHVSVRSGSWFASRHLPLSQLLYIFHLLRCGAGTTTVTRFFREANLYRETVTTILRQLQVKMWSVLKEKYVPTFDPSDELEIDEMWMNWQEPDNRIGPEGQLATWKGGHWIIGLVNRERTKLWIECMPNRKRDTIQKIVDPMLKKWLLRYPRIYTDALKSYDYLSKENTHYVINKVQDGFAIKETTFWGHTISVNVNHIENTWQHLRTHLSNRYAYRSPQFAHLYIAEFVYNWYKLNWYDLIKC